MKSVLISFVMFAVIGAALYSGIFDILASVYMQIFAVVCVVAALIFAVYTLGFPFTKDKKDDKE